MMGKSKSNDRQTMSEFIQILAMMGRIAAPPLGSNPELANFLRDLAGVLRSNPALSTASLLARLGNDVSSRAKRDESLSQSIDARRWTLDDVTRLFDRPGVTRAEVIDVIHSRFGMPLGSLSKLSRRALFDRLSTLVEEESTHESLARLATEGKRR